jgi:hypothetical protein
MDVVVWIKRIIWRVGQVIQAKMLVWDGDLLFADITIRSADSSSFPLFTQTQGGSLRKWMAFEASLMKCRITKNIVWVSRVNRNRRKADNLIIHANDCIAELTDRFSKQDYCHNSTLLSGQHSCENDFTAVPINYEDFIRASIVGISGDGPVQEPTLNSYRFFPLPPQPVTSRFRA